MLRLLIRRLPAVVKVVPAAVVAREGFSNALGRSRRSLVSGQHEVRKESQQDSLLGVFLV